MERFTLITRSQSESCRCGHSRRAHDHGRECEQQHRDSNGILWVCNCPEYRP